MPGKQEESTMTSILTRPLGASVAAALAAVLIIATPASATPGTTTVGDYMYSYDDADVAAGATITDYVGTDTVLTLSLIHISEPTRRTPISYAVFCLKK